MPSIFFGLNMASRALNAQNLAMLTAGHNISNANTKGYTRQRVNIAASEPYPYPSINAGWGTGQVGSGADALSVQRMRDDYLDKAIRVQTGTKGDWAARQDALGQMEAIFNEPSDNGIATVFNAFWDSWQELSTNAESVAVRALVRERGNNLATAVSVTAKQVEDYQAAVNEQVKLKVTEVNSYATQLAELNGRIANVTALGQSPNDLMDKRDMLLEDLAKVINFNAAKGPNNQMNVFVQGRALVRENRSYEIKAAAEEVSTALDGKSALVSLKWSDMTDVALSSGELNGLIFARDTVSVKYYERLDNMAKAVMQEVNAQHAAGFDLDSNPGGSFFDGFDPVGRTSARSMAVSAAIIASTNAIAAATVAPNTAPGGTGDGRNALSISLLRGALTHIDPPLAGGTYEDYLNGTIAQLGAESQEAMRMDANQGLLLGQLEQHQESVSGVSLDEEMADMVKFQHAYNAAARFLTAYDEMLDKLINGVGLVGR